LIRIVFRTEGDDLVIRNHETLLVLQIITRLTLFALTFGKVDAAALNTLGEGHATALVLGQVIPFVTSTAKIFVDYE
jgi:hypothetical protein